MLARALGIPDAERTATGGTWQRGHASLEHAQYYLRAQRSLEQAAFFMGQRERPETAKRRRRVLTEFLEWADTVPEPFAPSPLSCTAADFLQFMGEKWHQLHHGLTIDPNTGASWACPGYVEHAASQFATALRELGVKDCDNPALSVPVANYLKGYRRWMYSLGYKESSAVPVRWENIEAILADVDDQLVGKGGEHMSKVKIAMLCRP